MGDFKMPKQEQRSSIDRRTGYDRRQSRQLNLYRTDFVEQRQRISGERRVSFERREGYTPVSKWHSVVLGIGTESAVTD